MPGVTNNPLTIIPHNDVFNRVIINFSTNGGTVVTYWLSPNFNRPGPYQFFLEWAENPNADFVEVAGPTTGNYLTDNQRRKWSKLFHSVYRVRLDTPSEQFFSDPVYPFSNLNYHQFLTAKEIIRREYLRLIKYAGTKGYYLARKQWGEICSNCVDFNTGMVTKSDCLECFGTGFVGGYHSPSVLYIDDGLVSSRAQRDPIRSVIAERRMTARAVACPYVTSKDVWVNADTDERWSIEAIREIGALGRPLIYQIELRLIEPDNIIYQFPINNDSSSMTGG